MDERGVGLSERSATILGLIAEGRSYDQILHQQPDVTYFDIFAAAREALDLLQMTEVDRRTTEVAEVEQWKIEAVDVERPTTEADEGERPTTEVADGEVLSAVSRPSFIERARATHGRAWTRWTPDEDARLTALFRQGESRAEIVRQLGRQPGAVERRLLKLGLVVGGEGVGQGGTREIHPRVPGAVATRDGATLTADSPAVPGWEALRDRLMPRREIP